MQNCTFYIVRHGQTEWNVLGRMQGHLNSALTEQGKQEAKNTAEKLKHIHFDAVYSSDLIRAKDTAEIIKLNSQLEILTAKALRERTYGEADGMMGHEYDRKIQHLLEEYKQLTIEQKWKFKFAKGYESDEELVSRFITFLQELAVAYAGKTLIIVSHGGTLRTFLTKLGYAEHGKLAPGTFRNAGYIVVESDGVEFFLKEVEGVDYSRGLNTGAL